MASGSNRVSPPAWLAVLLLGSWFRELAILMLHCNHTAIRCFQVHIPHRTQKQNSFFKTSNESLRIVLFVASVSFHPSTNLLGTVTSPVGQIGKHGHHWNAPSGWSMWKEEFPNAQQFSEKRKWIWGRKTNTQSLWHWNFFENIVKIILFTLVWRKHSFLPK